MNCTAATQPISVPRYAADDVTRPAAVQVLVTQQRGQQTPSGPGIVHHLALPDHQDEAALKVALASLLSTAQVGLHLTLDGDEAFIWALRPVAREAGLLAEEITLRCTGGDRRLLFCVHCATRQAGTGADVQSCRHCGVLLEVRRHFSERLGAYLGVCADADQPYAQVRP